MNEGVYAFIRIKSYGSITICLFLSSQSLYFVFKGMGNAFDFEIFSDRQIISHVYMKPIILWKIRVGVTI